MKISKVIRVPILPFGMINAYIIVGHAGCIIVDTGLPGSEQKFAKALAHQGLSLEDVKLIIVTHAHVDHAGSAAQLRALTKAPILAHDGDLAYYQREQQMSFCPTGFFGRAFFKTKLILQPYSAFLPDILLQGNDCLNLVTYGVAGTVYSSPGHTAGSISLLLDNHEAIVGDLISSGILLGGIVRTSVAKRPPFEDNPHLVSQQLIHLINCGGVNFHMGHGGPLSSQEVVRHAKYLSSCDCHAPLRNHKLN